MLFWGGDRDLIGRVVMLNVFLPRYCLLFFIKSSSVVKS